MCPFPNQEFVLEIILQVTLFVPRPVPVLVYNLMCVDLLLRFANRHVYPGLDVPSFRGFPTPCEHTARVVLRAGDFLFPEMATLCERAEWLFEVVALLLEVDAESQFDARAELGAFFGAPSDSSPVGSWVAWYHPNSQRTEHGLLQCWDLLEAGHVSHMQQLACCLQLLDLP